jgi:hypothetical protein
MVLFVTGIVAIFFVGLALASLRRPAYAFALTLVMYPFEQLLQSQFPFFIDHRSFMNFLTAGVAGVAVVAAMVQGRRTVMIDRISMLVGLLYLVVVASTIWSINPELSWFTIRYWIPYMIAGAVILPMTINSPQDMRAAAKALLVVGTPLVIALAVAPMKGRGLVLLNEESWEQGNPLAVASFAAEMAILAIGFMLAERKSPQSRAILLAIAGLSAFVILRSGSRGQLLAAMAGIAVVSFAVLSGARRRNFLFAFIPACVLLGAVVFLKDAFVEAAGGGWIERRWNLEEMQETFAQSRVQMAAGLLYEFVSAASRNPLVLIGGTGAASSYQLVGFYCHVVPVEALCEYGIVGAALYLMILWAAVQSVRVMLKAKSIPSADKTQIAFLAGLFAVYFLLTFKQGSLFGHTEYFATAMIIGRLRVATLGVPRGVSAVAARSAAAPYSPATVPGLPQFAGPPVNLPSR